jgi:hypothetical protein
MIRSLRKWHVCLWLLLAALVPAMLIGAWKSLDRQQPPRHFPRVKDAREAVEYRQLDTALH